jgi:hypothetical protein
VWRKAWDELDQNRIREWIERIPFHIQEVIRLEGGNEYQEGRAVFWLKEIGAVVLSCLFECLGA